MEHLLSLMRNTLSPNIHFTRHVYNTSSVSYALLVVWKSADAVASMLMEQPSRRPTVFDILRVSHEMSGTRPTIDYVSYLYLCKEA
jgi:hypothetical protein